MNPGHLMLYVRTAAHLEPSQIAQRARLRTQRLALHRVPWSGRWLLAGPDPRSATGWPPGYRPLDAQLWAGWPGLGELRTGRIQLLGMTRALSRPTGYAEGSLRADVPAGPARDESGWMHADWQQAGAPALWRHHLHYWDWAQALAAEPDRVEARAVFATLWRSWSGAVVAGHGEAWLPYPASLRAWTFCSVHHDLVAGSQIEPGFLAGLSAHAGFLRRHLESDVGGNHLLKNLKALAGLAVFFADERLLARALGRLDRQLAVQVLLDGGHYERAPSYHCQVLADLIDIAGLLAAAGQSPPLKLGPAISRMRRWLGCVRSPTGNIPLLNDGYPVDPALVRLIEPDAAPSAPFVVLANTGLVTASAGDWHLLADVGPPCPDELPAHAHADTFHCLLHVRDVPLLVDTGTSTYAPGAARSYERSTAAHNTLQVDGANSTEVWGTFRAARRARVSDLTTHRGGELTIEAAHDGFRRLRGRPWHRRRWSLTDAGLRVDDVVEGSGQHAITVRWHLAPGSALRLAARGAVVTTSAGEFQVGVCSSGPLTLAAESAPVALGFGQTIAAPVLTCRIRARLPVSISTSWQRASGRAYATGHEPAFALGGAS